MFCLYKNHDLLLLHVYFLLEIMGSIFTIEIGRVNHRQSRCQVRPGIRQCGFDLGARQRTRSDQLHSLPNQSRTSIHFDQS